MDKKTFVRVALPVLAAAAGSLMGVYFTLAKVQEAKAKQEAEENLCSNEN